MRPLLLLLSASLLACSGDGKKNKGKGDIADQLLGVLVLPERVLLPVDSTVQLKATGLLEGRQTADLTNSVTWVIQDEGVAQVSNKLDEEGLLTGLGLGTTSLKASFEGVTSPAVTVEVIEASLQRLSVNPTSVTLTESDEVQLRAFATFSDGSEGEVSSQVRWITDDGGVAQIDSSGMLSAEDAGSTFVHAAWEDLESDDVPVVVEAGSSGGGGKQADLTITGASGGISGGYLELSVTFANTGTASATGFWVDAFVDQSSKPSSGAYGDAYVWVDYLAAGKDETLTFEIPVAGSSSDIWILVDTADDVDESDESDNAFSTTVSGSGSGGNDGPDLVATYFDYAADSSSIYYGVDVTNQGDENIDTLFYVDIFVDSYYEPTAPSDGDSYQSVAELAAGETAWVDFIIDGYCYYCESWVLLDSYDYIDESSESNNTDGPMAVYSE